MTVHYNYIKDAIKILLVSIPEFFRSPVNFTLHFPHPCSGLELKSNPNLWAPVSISKR